VAGFVVQLLTGTYVVLTPKQEAKVRRPFEEVHPDASLDLLDLTIRPMYESPTTPIQSGITSKKRERSSHRSW
jgi:hypothetical protein